MQKDKITLITTDQDLWNSADESHFFVSKDTVKPLPEILTPIIEDAMAQGLIREATEEEIKKYDFDNEVKTAIEEGKIIPGKDYTETKKRFYDYKKKSEVEKMPDLRTEKEKEEPKKVVKEEEPKKVVKEEESKKGTSRKNN